MVNNIYFRKEEKEKGPGLLSKKDIFIHRAMGRFGLSKEEAEVKYLEYLKIEKKRKDASRKPDQRET